jgi:hypothetical protein
MKEDFDPYPEGIYVYGNRMSDGGKNPDGLSLQALKLAMFGPTGALPDILWDGYIDPKKLVDGALPDALRICVRNDGAEVVNVDGPNGNKAPKLVTEDMQCDLPKLPEIALANGLGE